MSNIATFEIDNGGTEVVCVNKATFEVDAWSILTTDSINEAAKVAPKLSLVPKESPFVPSW